MKPKSILIADDDEGLVEALKLRCQRLGLSTFIAHDALTALALLDEHEPDVICLDVDMPPGNGLGVCEMLATDKRFSAKPMIILTGNRNEETIQRCHCLCAYYVEKCPGVWDRMAPLLGDLLGRDVAPIHSSEPAPPTPSAAPANAEPERPGPQILCIDDDSDFSLALKLRLERQGFSVRRAYDGRDGYRSAFAHEVDVILLDYELPNGRGDYVIGRLRENPLTRNIPILVLTGNTDTYVRRRLLNMGVWSVVAKPFEFTHLREEIEDCLQAVKTA